MTIRYQPDGVFDNAPVFDIDENYQYIATAMLNARMSDARMAFEFPKDIILRLRMFYDPEWEMKAPVTDASGNPAIVSFDAPPELIADCRDKLIQLINYCKRKHCDLVWGTL